MPTAFVEASGHFVPVALLSLTPGVNLFVAPDGRWLGSYVPYLFRCYPFRLMPQPDSDRYSLWVDADAGRLRDAASSTELFYDTEGNLAPSTKAIMNELVQFEQSHRASIAAIDMLAKAGALCPWPIKFKDGDAERTLAGVHRVDELALNNLGDDAFVQLRKVGALPIAYAQLLSMAQLGTLSQLAGLRQRMAQMATVRPDTAEVTQRPQGAFTMVDPETLRFD